MMEESTYGATCSTPRCYYSKLKPKATWANIKTGKWVCFTCAQQENRTAMQYRVSKPCYSQQEYMWMLLKQ